MDDGASLVTFQQGGIPVFRFESDETEVVSRLVCATVNALRAGSPVVQILTTTGQERITRMLGKAQCTLDKLALGTEKFTVTQSSCEVVTVALATIT